MDNEYLASINRLAATVPKTKEDALAAIERLDSLCCTRKTDHKSNQDTRNTRRGT